MNTNLPAVRSRLAMRPIGPFAAVAILLTCMAACWAVLNEAVEPGAPLGRAAGGAGSAVPQPRCDPNWQIVGSPNSITSHNYLKAVAALSSNDVWAAGYYQNGSNSRTLALHWDGTKWSKTNTPNPGSDNIDFLQGVAAVASNDVWAAGYMSDAGVYQTLVLHWNGASWSRVSSPNAGSSHNYLVSVTTVSADDVWAVGNYYNGSVNRTLALHWDGSAWNTVSSANSGTDDNYLTGVTAVATGDVWAVGSYESGGVRKTLTLNWNGTSWSVVSSPDSGAGNNYLRSVSAIASNDVWAVGYYDGGPAYRTLALHWDGSAWSIAASANMNSANNFLYGVTALSATDGWAVGYYYDGTAYRTMTLRYINGSWGPVASPNVGPNDNRLEAVTAISPGDVWAAGQQDDGSLFRTLATHWDGSAWSVVPSRNGEHTTSRLSSVSQVSADDIWAVGFSSLFTTSKTLIQHWDGSAWSIVPSPNPGAIVNTLFGVAAISSNDAWALGYYDDSGFRPLMLHWDGSAWSHIQSPDPPGENEYMSSVYASASNDVWAVGGSQFGTATQTLTMHWDGSTWSIVPSPNPGFNGSHFLHGVVALSATDAWAIGVSQFGGALQPLALHWGGSSWSVVSSPNPGLGGALYGVDALSAGDVWAVGSYQDSSHNYLTLVEHWDGSAWSTVPSPNPGSGADEFDAVTAISVDDVWAVGTGDGIGLIEHWDGSAWSIVPSPNPESINYLLGATAPSAGDVWAVGYYFPGIQQTLIERYNPCPPTATPPPTQTPGGPTATPVPSNTRPPTQTPGGPTATPEPTHCALEFSDVPPGSTFYDFTRCMACRGIINGYTSGCGTGNPCFRPNNNVTRGQLAKIVSNAAGFTEPAGSQNFEDVPPGSTFYDYVWRLYDRSVINGYACGAPGEPCHPPDNLPYFRPNNNATRGQISKIISSAANLPLPPLGQPTFEDVPEGSTFYEYIEALAATGAINGYPCGGVAEPCNPPLNRPYFRPSNNATRGQTSKIVANTFFPSCYTPSAYINRVQQKEKP